MGQLRVWGRPERLFYSGIPIAPQDSLSEQKNYRITAFANGNADINGLSLQLDHIQIQDLVHSTSCFIDHFMQGLVKCMKGTGEQEWTYEDYEDAFGDGSNLSNPKTRVGQELFELALAG